MWIIPFLSLSLFCVERKFRNFLYLRYLRWLIDILLFFFFMQLFQIYFYSTIIQVELRYFNPYWKICNIKHFKLCTINIFSQ